MAMMRWWMVPFFHKGPDVKSWKAMCTNARADKLKDGATWREPYRKRRGLVFADGFIEWTGPEKQKTRWLIERTDGEPLVFPALWDRWNSPEGPVESFAIITTDPGPEMAAYHTRQPVILEDDQAAAVARPLHRSAGRLHGRRLAARRAEVHARQGSGGGCVTSVEFLLLAAAPLTMPALANLCPAPPPQLGGSISGTVRYVVDGRGFCLSRSRDPRTWVQVRLSCVSFARARRARRHSGQAGARCSCPS